MSHARSDVVIPQLEPGKRWAIMGAVMLGLFLSAMDQTIVGTAMPRVIAELSGLHLYAWVFTSYMLASTTVMPIVGKMGDLYGRKNLFLLGIVVFLAGSMLAGTSQTMVQLILFRGLQGVGGGMIFANAFAIIGDLFPPAERGRYAGLMSGVFGLASVIGPLVGGYITDNLNWRWVFYVNLPLGAAALLVLFAVLPPSPRRDATRALDYWGALTLAATIVPLLLGFSWAGTEYAWSSPQVVGAFAIAAVMAAVFVAVERLAAEPIIPFALFRGSIFAVATAITFITGAAMFSGSVYIPLFMQGVLGFSATNSGLVMMPMTLALVIGSMISGQALSRTGRYKWLCVSGLALATGGMFILSTMNADSSQAVGMGGMAVLGFGLGITFTPLVLSVQNSVPFAMMGVTTSLNQFARSVGGTIGIAIMGSILTQRLNDELARGIPAEVQAGAPEPLLEALRNPRVLLDDAALQRLRDEGFGAVFGSDAARLFEETLASMKEALATSLSEIFLMATALMAAGFLLAFFLRELPLQTSNMPIVDAEGAGELTMLPQPKKAADEDAPATGVAG